MRLGQFNSRTPSVILLGRRRELPRFEGYVAVFSPDGRQVLTGLAGFDETGEVGEAILWDVATGRKLRTFEGHSDFVRSVAFSPDGRQVRTGSFDETAILWDVATGQKLRTFQGHSHWVNSVAFSPDGRYVLTGSGDRTVFLWEVK